MKKKILVPMTLAAMMYAAVAGATPMTDFHTGAGQIDLGMTQNKTKVEDFSFGNKWNFNGGVTYGIAEKLGLQYDYHNLKSGDTDGLSQTGNENEVNLLYTLDPNVAAFVGWNRIHGTISDGSYSDAATNNVAQLGLVGKTEIAKNLALYAKAAIGTKSTFLGDAGLGYNFANDWDFNVGYRYLKTDLDDAAAKFKGMYAGLTYRFGGPKKVANEDYVAPTTPAVTTPSVTAPAVPVAANDYYFNSIHFDFDKDNIKADQVANADSVVNAAKQTGHVFKLVGNTDGLGSSAYNDDLSKRRVDRVASYIKAKGVPANQIVTQYKGKNNPTATNNTDAGRAANRRVDVYEHK